MNITEIENKYPLFIGIHIGAGYHSNKLVKSYKEVVDRCLRLTKELVYKQLQQQQQSETTTIDSTWIVCKVISLLEDDPLTNAGRGSSLNQDGEIECDASIMNGTFQCCCTNNCISNQLKYQEINQQQQQKRVNNYCGGGIWSGVGAVNGVKNPIQLCHALLNKQRNRNKPMKSLGRIRPIMLVGDGAREWATNHSIETYSKDSLFGDPLITQQSNITYMNHRSKLEEYNLYKQQNQQSTLEQQQEYYNSILGNEEDDDDNSIMYDTVGAVVVDWNGNISSGVSSGGISLKHQGRVGEAAIYGSGCWAQNELIINNNQNKRIIPGVAASCTGVGEQISKCLMAKESCKCVLDKGYGDIGVKHYFQNQFLSHHDCFSYLNDIINVNQDKEENTDKKQVNQDEEEEENMEEEGEEEEEILNDGEKRLAGLISLRKETNIETNRMRIEFVWAHSTDSMVVGYISSNDQNPYSHVSRLPNNKSSGNSYQLSSIELII